MFETQGSTHNAEQSSMVQNFASATPQLLNYFQMQIDFWDYFLITWHFRANWNIKLKFKANMFLPDSYLGIGSSVGWDATFQEMQRLKIWLQIFSLVKKMHLQLLKKGNLHCRLAKVCTCTHSICSSVAIPTEICNGLGKFLKDTEIQRQWKCCEKAADWKPLGDRLFKLGSV